MEFGLRSTRSAGGPLAAASCGTATAARREFYAIRHASEADTARCKQRTSRPRRRVCRCPATLRVVVHQRININHQVVFAALRENSKRRFGVRTPRQLERRSRGAQRARRCRLPEECRLGIRRGSGSRDYLLVQRHRRNANDVRRDDSERRRRGSRQSSDRVARSGAAVDASAAAAALRPPAALSKSDMRLLGLRGGC
jgi:hypothetical protein